jgi:hypothetical protein
MRQAKRPIKLLGSLMGMTLTGHFLHYYRWDAASWQDVGCRGEMNSSQGKRELATL